MSVTATSLEALRKFSIRRSRSTLYDPRLYPGACIDAACGKALEQGVYSYKRVLALVEKRFAQALAALQESGAADHISGMLLMQHHALIREPDEYTDLFARAATANTAAVAATANTSSSQGGRACT